MLFTVSTDGKASEENEIATLKRYGVNEYFYSKMSNRIAHVPESLNEYPVVMVDTTDHEKQSAQHRAGRVHDRLRRQQIG